MITCHVQGKGVLKHLRKSRGRKALCSSDVLPSWEIGLREGALVVSGPVMPHSHVQSPVGPVSVSGKWRVSE